MNHTTRTVWLDGGDHAAARCTCGWTGGLHPTYDGTTAEQLGRLLSADAMAHHQQVAEGWKP